MAVNNCVSSLSKVFYANAQNRIGQEETIKLRQMFVRFNNQMWKKGTPRLYQILSGSKSEGFNFPTSDRDYMMVNGDVIVGMNNNDSYHHCMQQPLAFLMMETDETRPGFCLLRILRDYTTGNYINQVCHTVRYHDGLYLASAFWRNCLKDLLPESNPHGPCENGFPIGWELDLAQCFKCIKWPCRARPCINRLFRAGWPSSDILAEIVSNGCHVVAIGDKVSDKEFMEWRISFSEAETTLVHQMNHCQFLCYGLLKIFLKEVINTREDIDGLLCSYFLKTLMFWEITNNRSLWVVENFLERFWDCFRRLISWVKNGYCPNFFIPDNNMFLGKIHGISQNLLLHHLISLYNKGYYCIPVCKCDNCTMVLSFPHQLNCVTDRNRMDKMSYDLLMIEHFTHNVMFQSHTNSILRRLNYLGEVKCQNEINTLIIDMFVSLNIQNLLLVFVLDSFNALHISNKAEYNLVCKSINGIKGNAFDVSTHHLISALLLYHLRMYKHSSRILLYLRGRFQRSRVLHPCSTNLDEYRAEGGESLPFDIMMRNLFFNPLDLSDKVSLPELGLEHKCTGVLIKYEPLLFLGCLLFLCYNRMSMYEEADIELRELTSLMYNGFPMPHQNTMSWEVLGVCQEMSGYIQDAYDSYMKALNDPNYRLISKASRKRIQNLEERYGDFLIRS